MSAPTFRFDLLAAQADPEGYYVTRWDQATPIAVVAATKQQALDMAGAALGPARSGRYWTYRVERVVDARIPEGADR